MVHVPLKPGLEDFEHYFASMWDECKCVVVWTFFGIAFLWDWNETDFFQSRGHCWIFQLCWHVERGTFTASSFRIWNSWEVYNGVSHRPYSMELSWIEAWRHLTDQEQGWMEPGSWWLSFLARKYSWPLNNTGLNCTGPLILKIFNSK